MNLNGQPVSLEIDTGVAVSINSEKAQKKLFPTAALERADVRPSIYIHHKNQSGPRADICHGEIQRVRRPAHTM